MARIFTDDGGDSYDWSSKLVRWSTSGNNNGNLLLDGDVETSIPGATGHCLRLQLPSNCQYAFLRYNFNGDFTRVIYGMRFQTQSLPATGYHSIAGIWDNAATLLSLLAYDSSGSLSIWRGGYPASGGTHVGSFSNPNTVQANTWINIEVDTTLDNGSSGAFTIRANSQSIVTASGVQTSPNANGARMFSIYTAAPLSGGFIQHYFDDDYVNNTIDDGTGTCNGFDGDVQNLYFPASGVGQYTQQAIGGSVPAGSNWASVSQVVPDDDVTYVTAASVGLKDTYAVDDLPVNVVKIVSVDTILDSKTDVSGLGAGATIRPLIGKGTGSPATGTNVSINTSYIDKVQHWGGFNPLTGAAWVLPDWPSIEIGHERTA